jgi:outer membrane protein
VNYPSNIITRLEFERESLSTVVAHFTDLVSIMSHLRYNHPIAPRSLRTLLSVVPALFAMALVVNVHAQTIDRSALNTYITTALQQNPDMQAARARWDQASSRVDQAYSNLWPHVDVTMRYMDYQGGRVINFNGNPVHVSAFGVTPWDNKIDAIWPIFNTGVWYGTAATKAYRNAATATVDEKSLSIALAVSEAYFSYAKSSELVTIREAAVKLAEENHRTAEALYRAGKAQKNDVLRADVAVASAEGDLLDARNQQSLTQSGFNELLHRDFSETIDLPKIAAIEQAGGKDLAQADTSRMDLDQLPPFDQDVTRAFAGRPELSELENSAKALEGYRAVSASDYFPNVALFATYGFQEDKLTFDTQQDYFAAGVQLHWNLFSGFNTMSKVAENDAQILEIKLQHEAALGGIRLELQNARQSLESSRERHTIGLRQLNSAEENYRVTKEQYAAGMVPLITMIDAETTLANARANLTTAAYDVLTSESRYQKALGNRP